MLAEEADRLVRDYLAAVEARDLERARPYLAEGAELIFPGGKRPKDLDQLVANSGGRYQKVAKRIEGVDVQPTAEGAIAYCHGVLYGMWADGAPFDDVRFVDRFEIVGGRIARQWVWNDAGEHRIARLQAQEAGA
ncbi:MAG: nuclear transport factor 2 family protein [Alphaproteobacteria bacterium]|nr:nuclear transport factor 2 family protein [Alphaproteobacteria bacterium]